MDTKAEDKVQDEHNIVDFAHNFVVVSLFNNAHIN